MTEHKDAMTPGQVADMVAELPKIVSWLREQKDQSYHKVAGFIETQADELTALRAERDAALARVGVLTELLVRNMVFDPGSADDGLKAVGGWAVVDKIISARAALANKGADE